jgi:alpha-ketoglutaric semialdehyde dehydrogenase
VQAEMGGQNAAVVLADADLKSTASMLVNAAMGYAGQKCTATRRVITTGDPVKLLEALRGALSAAIPGDPANDSTLVGPVINEIAHRKLRAAVDEASACGAHLVNRPDTEVGDGWYVSPTFVSGLVPEHRLLQEETFGPFAAVLPARDTTEAVRLANDVRYGLVSSVHGNDLEEVLDVVAELETGMIKVNAPTTGVDFYLPFGGEKDSSMGPREQGKAAMDFYSSTRTVTLTTPSRA